MRPPFSYFGGKTRLARRIVEMLPEHRQYVEPYAGGLSVLLAKPRARMEVVNDLDGDLMTFWRVLRDRPDELARVCALTPHSRTEYATCADLDVSDELERARRVWSLLAQGRAGSTNPRNAGWRYRKRANPYGAAHVMGTYVRYMPEVAERLAGVSLEQLPAPEVIERYGAEPSTLLYVDPPYLGAARASQNERYAVEQLDVSAHRELADALRACRASVVLSGFDSPEYADLFDGWHSHRFETTTNRGNQSTKSVEVLWSNRPLAGEVGQLGADVDAGGTLGDLALVGGELPEYAPVHVDGDLRTLGGGLRGDAVSVDERHTRTVAGRPVLTEGVAV